MTNKFIEIIRFFDPRHDFDHAAIDPAEQEFLKKFGNGQMEAAQHDVHLGRTVMKGLYRGGPLGLLLGAFYDAATGHPGSATTLGACTGMLLDSGQILIRETMRQRAREKAEAAPENNQI